MSSTFSASLLGTVVASIDGKQIELGSPTQRTVFAVLAANGNRVVSRGELIRAVWGESAFETAVNSVYTYVARLRKCLQLAGERMAESEVLYSDSLGYMLRIPWVDSHRFTSALTTVRKLRACGATEQAVAKLGEGLALWRGTPYLGAVGAFVESERARLIELKSLAVEEYAEMLLELERPAECIAELSALVHSDPLRERPRLLLMRARAALGQHADAIRDYHTLREALAEKQGIEPGERLRELYEHVLKVGRSQRPQVSGADVHLDSEAGRSPTRTPHQSQPESVALARTSRWFRGRAEELRALKAIAGDLDAREEAPLLLLTGGPGVGKSALATRFAGTIADFFPDGQVHVDLRRTENGASRSVDSTLRDICTKLDGAPSSDGDPAARYSRLVVGRRMLFVLDNATSVDEVRPLLPPSSSCLILVTSRFGLSGLIARDGAQRFTVNPLGHPEALELFTGIVGSSFVAAHRTKVEELIRECEGHPLALRIAATLISVASFPATVIERLLSDDLISALRLPGDADSDLSAVLSSSYELLSPEAACVYRAFGWHRIATADLRTLMLLTGLGEAACLGAVEALTDAGLLREVLPGRFHIGRLLRAHARQLVRMAELEVKA